MKLAFKPLIILVLTVTALFIWQYFKTQKKSQVQDQVQNNFQTEPEEETSPLSQIIAENLDTPWSMEFLPEEGTIILTERKGRILTDNGEGEKKVLLELNDAVEQGEGGLLGLALHPDYEENNLLYFYYTYRETVLLNKVVRFRKENNRLIDEKIIIDKIPANSNHNGGRIKFGPDGLLYITTGDSQNPSSSQNRSSLAGKILRIKDDGTIPADNPFPNSPVFSYGHRNPQGLAWDREGNLWSTEHGPRANDELNLIEKGKNYGWPQIQGDETRSGMENPVLNSGSSTWAPSGIAFLANNLYFAGLRGESLYRVSSLNENPKIEQFFKNEFGRLRDVVVGPDNMLYALTSNTDGRGIPKPNDDKIIRINPNLLDLN